MVANPLPVRLDRIGQIAVPVRDVDRATAFYRDVLGLPFLFAAPNLAFFQCGDVRLMLTVPESPAFDHPASIIYYRVEDIAAAYRALTDRGVTFGGEPRVVHRAAGYELWLADFRDSEENVLCVMAEVGTVGG